MTAPQPATPGSGSVRARIADRLAMWDSDRADRIADYLVPLVDRLRAEAKAEALEEAADAYWRDISITRTPDDRNWLLDRAAAYRTNPSSEEQP